MAPFKQVRLPAHLNPEKRGRGRPSEYRPEYCDLVIETMAKGLSLTAFAGLIRVGRETIYGWISAHSEFSDAVSRARAARTLAVERKLMSATFRGEVAAAIFLLKNCDPVEWKDVRYPQHNCTPSDIRLTLEELQAIAAGEHRH
jgi:hypothetical protein